MGPGVHAIMMMAALAKRVAVFWFVWRVEVICSPTPDKQKSVTRLGH
jgi:hypothetical protein